MSKHPGNLNYIIDGIILITGWIDLNSELTHKWNANKNTNRIVFLCRQLNYKVQLEGEKTKTSQKQPDKRKAKGERLAYEI